MTTITALNVRLGMDVSNFSEGANLAKGEVTKVASIMRQSVPPAEKYRQELDLLNRAFSDAGKQSAQYANAVDHLAKKHQQGKYSAEELQKAQDVLNLASERAAEAARKQKEETARLAEIEKQRQAVMQQGRQLTQSLQTAEEAYWQRFAQYKELRRSGAITEETYKRALAESKATLESSRNSTDTAIAAAKKLKEEKLRLAEAEKQHQQVMERGKQLTQSVERAQESHNRRVREYRELLRAGAIDQETYRRAVERSNKTLKESQTSSTSAIASIKGMAAAYLGVQTIAKSLNLAGQVEDATIAFEVLTGSVNDGKVLFEQIRQLDKNTPITFVNATQAAKTMLSFGVQVQDVAKNLQMLSDVTGGNNDRFKMLALAFSQMSAAGRLMGQDVLQMINAGFNPLQQISKTTGESLIDLKKRMEDGAISSQEVRKAFEDATSAGGMFHGMTDRLAQTVSGKMNIALSEFEKKLGEIGASLGPLVSQLLDLFTQLQPWLEATARLIGRVAEGFGYMLARIRDIMSSIINFTWDETETNKFLDGWEKRQREQAEAARQQIKTEFEQRKAAVNEVAIAEHKAQQEIAEAKKKAVEEQEKAAKAAAKDEEKRIKDLEKERLKAIETERKEREKAAKQAEEQFARDLNEARKGAMEFFKKQEEKNQKRREDIAAGPGAGIELGSAEAVKFSADRINKAMAEGVIPEQQETPWGDLGEKTAQLFKEQQIANQINREQTQILFSILTESKENGFRRIR
jgi:tape measure domain-containing protein